MKWGKCKLGSLKIDGEKHTRDVILDRGELRRRLPWECKRLVIGTGIFGNLPVMEEVKADAQKRGVELVVCPTPEAVQGLKDNPPDTNAILHVTC